MRSLLSRGAEVNAKDHEWEQTALIFASAQNRVAAIQALLEGGADPSLTSKVIDLKADLELAEAAENRQKKVLRSYKMQSEIEGEFIPSASQFQAAVVAGRDLYLSGKLPEISEADPNERRFRPRLVLKSKGGLTALLHAARQGHTEAVMTLLDGDADINQVSAGDGTSPLLMATINGQFDLALRLLERGADPNVAAKVNDVTPLWAAVNAKWQPRTRFPQPQEFDLQEATYLDLTEALFERGRGSGRAADQPPVVHGLYRLRQSELRPRRHQGLDGVLARRVCHGRRCDGAFSSLMAPTRIYRA